MNNQFQIHNRIIELEKSGTYFKSNQELEIWIYNFVELHNSIYQIIPVQNQNEMNDLKQNIINSYTSKILINNLYEVVFEIGVNCLFRNKLKFIKHLWEYKQPLDTNVNWIGADIFPQNFKGIIYFFFKKGIFDRRIELHEGHHGSEIYIKKYFLLLLTNSLNNIQFVTNDKISEIENYHLPEFNIYRLHDIGQSIDELIHMAENVIFSNRDLLEGTGIKSQFENIDDLKDKKLFPLLSRIKSEAQRLINKKHIETKVSQLIVEKFKDNVIKRYYENDVIREIFKNYLTAFQDSTNIKVTDSSKFLEIKNDCEDKAVFFEEWYISYIAWENHYGNDLANKENTKLFDQISSFCVEIEKNNFEDLLINLENPENYIIFSSLSSPVNYFNRYDTFQSTYTRKDEIIDTKGFFGWFKTKTKFIPIFQIYTLNINNEILILNKNKLGSLVQYSSMKEDEIADLTKDIFYIDVNSYSENQVLLEKLVEESPHWLKEVGDEEKQIDYLKTMALIKIRECFEFIKSDDFEGYKIIYKDSLKC
jgi:hypothetical protein